MRAKIETLTAEQKRTFESLVMLGDSEELALETVLAMTPRSEEELNFYRFAYEN